MSLVTRPVWEYGQLVVVREPSPDDWPVTATFYDGDGQSVPLDGSDPVAMLNKLGTDGWELVGAPEVFSVVATHTDSGGGRRDRAYWVERRFWLKRRRAS